MNSKQITRTDLSEYRLPAKRMSETLKNITRPTTSGFPPPPPSKKEVTINEDINERSLPKTSGLVPPPPQPKK